MEQALSLQDGLGEKGSASETRLALAELACNTGRPSEAGQLARSALQEFQKQKESDHAISAAALLARSFLLEGNVAEAAQTIAKDVEKGRAIQNLSVRLSVALDRAAVLVATNDLTGAERAARQVSAQADGSLVRLHLEAALVLSTIQMKRDVREGRKLFEELARTARAKGFELIARKAAALAL